MKKPHLFQMRLGCRQSRHPKSKSGFRLAKTEEQTDEFHQLKSLETRCFPRRK